jgi:oxygen-independent coproporphyrinogen-3 oxidase
MTATNKMGLYWHIPYCRKACHYCNFHFSTNLKSVDLLLEAMLVELRLRTAELEGKVIETIYFGGGTPSILSADQIMKLLEAVSRIAEIPPNIEITFECNPEDLEAGPYLKDLKAYTPINRLSVGVQSFYDEHLLYMNRSHSGQMALSAIKRAQDTGFENITADLIYGVPGLTDKQWESNVATMVGLGVPHISCYALTLEPKTPLEHLVKVGKLAAPTDELMAQHFNILIEALGKAGFLQYEISNFARPSFEAVHNKNYWFGVPYMGLGPGAHSFDGVATRSWNISNNQLYINQLLEQKARPFEMETLTDVEQLNEFIMTRLRTMEGVAFQELTKRWGASTLDLLLEKGTVYVEKGLLEVSDRKTLLLTSKGKLLADKITSDLFFG